MSDSTQPNIANQIIESCQEKVRKAKLEGLSEDFYLDEQDKYALSVLLTILHKEFKTTDKALTEEELAIAGRYGITVLD